MDPTKNTGRTMAIAVVLGGITLAAFWPVVHNDFVNYDDTAYVTENPHVLAGLSLANAGWAFRANCLGNWHPLTMLSHMMDVQLFGLNPGWHHGSSLCLHVANSRLLFLLLGRLTSRVWRSAFVAALFALHPLHVESVAWVSERKDVLSTFFGLLSLLAYARFAEVQSRETEVQSPMSKVQGREPEVQGSRFEVQGSKLPASFFYVLSLFFFALGLMSKPMLVTLPFVLLLLDFWPLRRFQLSTVPCRLSTYGRLVLEKWPFFLLSAGACVVTFIAQQESGALGVSPAGPRVENALVAYARYLGKTLWPNVLAIPYPPVRHWPLAVAALAAVLLAVLTLGALWQGRRFPYIAVGWLWFLGTLIPVIGIIQVGDQSMADRYTYFPLIGLFVALVWTATEIAPGGRYQPAALATVGAGVLLVCAMVTRQQVRLWRNSETLFLHATEVTRGNYVAHNGLGLHYFKQGRVDEAVRQYRGGPPNEPAL